MDGSTPLHPFDRPTGPAFEVEVRVHEGPSAGQKHVLRRFPVYIGRGREVDVRLEDDPDDPTLSRRHLKVTLEAGRVVVADLSTNGTWIDRHLLEPGEHRMLEGDEPVWLGPRTMITIQAVGAPRPPCGASPGDRGATRGGAVGEAPLPRTASRPFPHDLPVLPAPCPVEDVAARPSMGSGAVSLEIAAMGRFHVTVHGVGVPESAWFARKAMVLLAFLAESGGRPVSPERLGEALWPDAEEGSKQALQTAVSRVRRAFRSLPGSSGLPDPIPLDRSGYHIHPDYAVWYDASQFQNLCEEAFRRRADGKGQDAVDSFEQALALYRGPFFEGHMDEWVHARRRALDGLYFDAVDAVALLWEASGRFDEAARQYRVVVEREPCREQSQAGLIRCLKQEGKREEAVRQYQACVRTLKKSLGLSPGPELVALYESLRAN